MKKIEQAMVDAIKAGREFKSGNTEVIICGGSLFSVRLHGNAIARNHGRGWEFSLAGWNTVTTRSRINALARGLYWHMHVYNKDGMARRSGPDSTPISTTDWHKVSPHA